MYTPLLIVHICAGTLAVLAGFTALFVRKGTRLHRGSGSIFVASMLVMAAGGAWVAFTKSQPMNVVAGLFTLYLVATAWLTVRRREMETGRAEIGLVLAGLAVGVGSLMVGWIAAHSATGLKSGDPAAGFFVFGTLALLAAAGDIRMLIRGGVSGPGRLARHLWRMCFAMFIAAGSFFLGQSGDPVLRQSGLRARLFPEAVRQTHLPEVPVILILVLMIFWLIRVRFARPTRPAGGMTR